MMSVIGKTTYFTIYLLMIFGRNGFAKNYLSICKYRLYNTHSKVYISYLKVVKKFLMKQLLLIDNFEMFRIISLK